jgi:hypothetical protein
VLDSGGSGGSLPRAPGGKPDLTGVYQASARRGDWDFDVPGNEPGVPAARPAGAVAAVERDPVPYQDWARAKAQTYLDRRSIDDPTTLCQPQSSPRMTPTGLFPIQFVQTPQQVVILYEYFWLFRVIPTDGRGHPDDVEPTFMGDAVGRWEGDTLVVDVASFKDGGWLAPGVFHSDSLQVTERYTRIDRDQLNYEATIADPKVFTAPWKIRVTLMLREKNRLREYSCMENNLDMQRYLEFAKNPSLFLRKPEDAGR